MLNFDQHHPTLVHELELLAEKYSKASGHEVFNVSHWNAGVEYQHKVESVLQLQPEGNRFDYEFSQTLPHPLIASVAMKLGISSARFTLITPSGTNANLLALVLLKSKGRRRLIIVGPCYFHVPVLAKALGLEVVHAENWQPGSGLSTNLVTEPDAATDAFWITNPVYCFGHVYSNAQAEDIAILLEKGYALVADECNSPTGSELGRKLDRYTNFIGTYSPHKSVCVNGLKFGIFNVARSEMNVVRLLGDSWSGPLPRSIRTDMRHFVSDNFLLIEQAFRDQLEKNARLFQRLIAGLPVATYPGKGHFRVVTVSNISNVHEASLDIFEKVVADTLGAFIPMACNYGPSSMGFSFRVNLLADMPKIAAKLPQLIDSITRHCR